MHFIKGLQKTSLVDYPGKVCATIFLAKCNFRCGFCYNKNLILEYEKLPDISEEEVLGFLEKRKKWLDGVCISGGEPCIHGKKLIDFIAKIKKIGLLVKLDTNGSYPDLIEELLKNNLIDYIAMDIKGPLEKYNKICNVKVNINNIKKSIKIIKDSKINYEFRTSVIPNLIKKEDIIKIAKLLKGSKNYYMQQFRPEKNKMLDKGFEKMIPYSGESLEEIKKTVKKYFNNVEIRNV